MNLPLQESNQLKECESVIKKGLNTFIEVGNALMIIRDNRLYRLEFPSFEKYCNDKWNLSKMHAYRIINSAEVVNNLESNQLVTPKTESQARPLTKLGTPEDQTTAWSDAVTTAELEGRNVTAKDVEQAVEKVKENSQTKNNNQEQRKESRKKPNYKIGMELELYCSKAISHINQCIDKIEPNKLHNKEALKQRMTQLSEAIESSLIKLT